MMTSGVDDRRVTAAHIIERDPGWATKARSAFLTVA
jgi:hypothetical protein